eukprot:1151491-Pelagomonas_calceolata.AAC.3
MSSGAAAIRFQALTGLAISPSWQATKLAAFGDVYCYSINYCLIGGSDSTQLQGQQPLQRSDQQG